MGDKIEMGRPMKRLPAVGQEFLNCFYAPELHLGQTRRRCRVRGARVENRRGLSVSTISVSTTMRRA